MNPLHYVLDDEDDDPDEDEDDDDLEDDEEEDDDEEIGDEDTETWQVSGGDSAAKERGRVDFGR
jgi:hypothetical protein